MTEKMSGNMHLRQSPLMLRSAYIACTQMTIFYASYFPTTCNNHKIWLDINNTEKECHRLILNTFGVLTESLRNIVKIQVKVSQTFLLFREHRGHSLKILPPTMNVSLKIFVTHNFFGQCLKQFRRWYRRVIVYYNCLFCSFTPTSDHNCQ